MDLNTDIGTLAGVVGGKLLKGGPHGPFRGFVTDSRKVKSGDFFWALKGGLHDAHDHLASTLDKGAAGWIAGEARVAEFKDLPAAVIGVKDTLSALQTLAAWHRRRFPLRVAAITGSNGKSTTKEMLRSIFAEAGPVCSNAGNLNNHFGLPLSLLELLPEHKFGVFELGASKKGDILEIGKLAGPSVAVITNIGPSHLEFFGDLETVFRTKTELIDCLEPDGVLVYNADDPYLKTLVDRPGRKLSFGCGEADIRISGKGTDLTLAGRGDGITVSLPAGPKHDRLNAAAAAAAALACGLGFKEIKAGLESFTPPPMRMQRLELRGSVVILDAYNANPASMNAALESVFSPASRRPVFLALGDMKELGRHSAGYHAELGEKLAGLGAEKIFLAGPEMKAAAEALRKKNGAAEFEYAGSPEAWAGELRAAISAGKGTFLLKASRSMKFEKLIEGL